MTALTATPDADGTVLLQVSAAPAGPVTITRSDDNGVAGVRLLQGQTPVGGVLTVTDYEPALTGLIRYDVTDSAAATTSASTTLQGLAVGERLGVPVLPQLGVALERLTDLYSSTRDTTGTVHEVIDRPDPIVTLGRARSRAGRLEAWCSTYAAARAVEQVYDRGEVVQLRQDTYPGLDMYHVAEATTLRPAELTTAGWRWVVEISYREVAVPTGPRLGDTGWTWADLSAQYPSWAAMRTAYVAAAKTWADVTAGPA